MSTITQQTFRFLRDLRKNNNREWFQENRSRYDSARDELESLVEDLIGRISKFDPDISGIEPKKAIFRIYRDTRFSANKLPYKTNLGAHIVADNARPQYRAGYYLHLEPGNCFLGGGAYMPTSSWLREIRDRIASDGEELRKILRRKSFKDYFGELRGEQLKSAPRGFPKDHPEIELLRYKGFTALHEVTEKQVVDEGFPAYCSKVFKTLMPFDQFLNGTQQ